jgi:PAS domain S-box-containing protein
MSSDNKLLNRLRVLYVEDDEHVRSELTLLLSKFFKTVYTAKDGQEGLDLYHEHKENLDLVIADINMPNLNGIEMVQQIRKEDESISIIFATAYSDNEFLSESIKLKVYDYIIKPIDVRALLTSVNKLAKIIYNKELLEDQNHELEQYKQAIDSYNMVLKLDTKMKIVHVNELFCQTTGYDSKELIGQEFHTLKHQDTDSNMYNEIYSKVLDNKSWTGSIKQIAKDGAGYIVDTFMITRHNDSGNISGAIAIQRNITKEIKQKRDVQKALMKDKGDIFIKSKEGSAEQTVKINQLEEKLNEAKGQVNQEKVDKDKYMYLAEKLQMENKKLQSEILHYKKDSSEVEDKSSLTLRTNRENHSLKQKISLQNAEIEELQEEIAKQVAQTKVTYEIQLDDLEKELNEYKTKLDSIEDGEILTQKIDYWKAKAKNEVKRAEELERKIMQVGDKSILQKLFGNK